ncbi:class I SAM-dependent methyltransferase [Pseudoalteromonas xiamenensis]|uniref:class I SAM-dependent methyltransferase n=1 Tax=Pseudoalteromonas xiamenensis TaxID=882626 RepID=UPI0027E4B01E|nr:class I SAM-dependent methyltransferase [Pseudoalteromonas xiamenensis]WMN60007.1 class I SAM-dependent methyltransferase [Pseudoalteromonas xiamenensis]
MNSTIEYYQNKAQEYAAETLNIDMYEAYRKFVQYVSAEGKILDIGCGSGRDSLYFIKQGFKVVATEPTPALRDIASAYTGLNVLNTTFQALNFNDEFDGIWCCASLLHVPTVELPSVINNLVQSLKQNGVLYISVKKGNGEQNIGGRHFTFFTEHNLVETMLRNPKISLVDTWQNSDYRLGESNTCWLNFIFLKDN